MKYIITDFWFLVVCLVNTILNTVCILKLVVLKPVSPYIENDTAFIHGFSESLSSYTETSTAIWHGFCKTVCTNFNISAKIPCENPLHSPCLGQFSVRLLYIFYIGAGLLQTWVPEGWIRACTVFSACLSRPDCFVWEDLKTQNSSDIKGNNSFKFKLKD